MRMLPLLLGLLLAGPAGAELAPDFTLRDLDGRSVSLKAQRGEVVLISFWATWCAPCQVEMPHLQRFQETYGERGFKVLSINMDDARSLSQVKPLVRSRGFTFPVLVDRETAVVAMYNPSKTLPYAVLVDRDGNIAKRFNGYSPGDEVHVEDAIKGLLAPAEEGAAP